jgi:hypothetical protein
MPTSKMYVVDTSYFFEVQRLRLSEQDLHDDDTRLDTMDPTPVGTFEIRACKPRCRYSLLLGMS